MKKIETLMFGMKKNGRKDCGGVKIKWGV